MKKYILCLGAMIFMASACKSALTMSSISIDVTQPEMPLQTNRDNILAKAVIRSDKPISVKKIAIDLKAETNAFDLNEIEIYLTEKDEFKSGVSFGKIHQIKNKNTFNGNYTSAEKTLYVWVVAKTVANPNLLNKIKVTQVEVNLPNSQKIITKNIKNPAQRFAFTVRDKKQDGVECYRIPGLATTNKGTLIAVYDNRYNNCKDLQEDVNVGMSRSTDGGQTWEPMKEIMDLGEWGGLSNQLNGIGDPAVLVDKNTGTIWVAALWLHGHDKDKMAWWASKPGMTPHETGQLMLVKSDDDGITWSDPISITPQTKDPKWYLFFNGPGNGITLADGKIMFAAQYKDENQVPHSTLIYSDDHGKTWHCGTGAKSHTTEAQVVQLSDGSIMLNMRDDRNRQNYTLSDAFHGRSVAITRDFGKTWTEHSTSRKALTEPNCMASIISYSANNGKQYLFFSNPADAKNRINITIKASDDDGNTWNKLPQIKLYANGNFGYSCMSLIDNKYIGILYEGVGDLIFQKIPISELIK
ncbi:sialidase family protein [Capnocytophaga canis]|uniref:sialidase family protein n=1 Tax=Capnocytophaga canis TaxID=1848903 RepID=UPI001F50F763|nr:sialidase family protein [Capnocytophaga canis]